MRKLLPAAVTLLLLSRFAAYLPPPIFTIIAVAPRFRHFEVV